MALMSRISSGSVPAELDLVPVELVVRDSTAPPPG